MKKNREQKEEIGEEHEHEKKERNNRRECRRDRSEVKQVGKRSANRKTRVKKEAKGGWAVSID
jgi:hypothetical protein